MKFKSFIDSDIVDDFRKLNVGIVNESKEELVYKIEKKFGIKNDVIELIDDINILLGRRSKVGFTFETKDIEKKIKNLNKKKIEAVKLKLFESNSFLSEMKMELEKKIKENLGE